MCPRSDKQGYTGIYRDKQGLIIKKDEYIYTGISMSTISENIGSIINGDLQARRAAVKELVAFGDEAIEPLIAALCETEENDVRWYIAGALARIGEPAVPQLTYTLKVYPDDDVKRYCAAALGEIGEPAIAELIEIFETEDGITRGFASQSLVRIGESAIAPLQKLVDSTDPESIPHRCAVVTLHKLRFDPENV